MSLIEAMIDRMTDCREWALRVELEALDGQGECNPKTQGETRCRTHREHWLLLCTIHNVRIEATSREELLDAAGKWNKQHTEIRGVRHPQ